MIKTKAELYADYIVSIRRELHKYPEIGFSEFKTSEIIKRELNKLGIENHTCAKTGVVGLIRGNTSGKTVMLRADIDGLPINEENNIPYKSENNGFMHACGHDVHTACLIGAAKILNECKDNIKGNIKLVFQPAEESIGGALPMIEEGVLDNPLVDAAFALHVEPLLKTGKIQYRNGAIMACPDEFTIKIHGKGGHGSAPNQCIDPITVSAAIINEYQSIVRKNINPMIPCVVSICSVHAGTCANVIPSEAVMEGTLRALDNETRFFMAKKIEETAINIAKNMGAECEFEYRPLYPPVINNEKMNEIVKLSAKKTEMIDDIIELPYSSMAGDDFSYFTEKVPGAYFRLGVGTDGENFPIHNSKFHVDDNSLKIGSAILAQISVDFLNS